MPRKSFQILWNEKNILQPRIQVPTAIVFGNEVEISCFLKLEWFRLHHEHWKSYWIVREIYCLNHHRWIWLANFCVQISHCVIVLIIRSLRQDMLWRGMHPVLCLYFSVLWMNFVRVNMLTPKQMFVCREHQIYVLIETTIGRLFS